MNKEPAKRAPNVIDIVGNLVDCIENEVVDPPQGFVVGGAAVAALMDPETKLHYGHGSPAYIETRPDLYKSSIRDNGSVGDLDYIINSSSKELADAIRSALTPNQITLSTNDLAAQEYELSKPGAKLKIGVTPLKTEQEYNDKPRNPLKRLAKIVLKDFVSERVVDAQGNRSFRIFDLSVPLPDEYFEPWQQQLPNGNCIPVMHPVIQMTNYIARTCYDEPRTRDVEKLEKMEGVVGPVFGIALRRNNRGKIIGIDAKDRDDPAYAAALDFLDKKQQLHYAQNKSRGVSSSSAGLFAIKQALHKPADTYLEKWGQQGWLYDHVLSRATGERQQDLQS